MTIHDLGQGVKLATSDEWRGTECVPRAQVARAKREKSITEFIVHYSGGATLGAPDTVSWLRNIWRYHVETKGYSDIAYNAAIRDGIIWELRPGWARGAHTLPNYTGKGIQGDHNEIGFGVVWLNAAGDPLNPQDFLCFRYLYAITSFAAGRQPLATTHQDCEPPGYTECPGVALEQWVHSGDMVLPPEQSIHNPPVWIPPIPTIPSAPRKPLELGRKGPKVREYQTQMNVRGWHLTVDGIYGPETEAATKHLQEKYHLEVTGVVDAETWAYAWLSEV